MNIYIEWKRRLSANVISHSKLSSLVLNYNSFHSVGSIIFIGWQRSWDRISIFWTNIICMVNIIWH